MKKLKIILSAFSGLIIYSALTISTQYFTDNHTLAYLIADLVFAVLGGLYTTVVLGPADTDRKMILSKKFLLAALGIVLFYCFVSMFTSNALIQTFYGDSMQQTEQGTEPVILALITNVLAAPMAEELIFRGCMYRFLSGLDKKAALILSSAIFAVWHGTFIHLYAAFFGGLIFCCIYEKTKSIKYPIFAHMLFNGFTLIIGCAEYPHFVLEPWWLITLNSMLITMLILLYRMSGECKITSVKTAPFTPEQQAERKKTAEIVDSVMSEHKSRH